MRKLGPLLAIIGGIATIVLATIALLGLYDVIDTKFATDVANKGPDTGIHGSLKTIWFISLGIGVLQLAFGFMAWNKPRGFASFILLVLFGAAFAMLLASSIKEDSWPTSHIVGLVVDGLAALGLLVGILKGNE